MYSGGYSAVGGHRHKHGTTFNGRVNFMSGRQTRTGGTSIYHRMGSSKMLPCDKNISFAVKFKLKMDSKIEIW